MTKLDLAHLAEVAGKLNAALAAHDDVMESYISASTQADYLAALGERDDRADEALFEHLAALDRGDVADLLALLDRLREAEEAWQPIETAPRPEEYQPMVCVLLSWTDVSQEGEVRQTVGEGYWRAEGAGGDWWWANLGPGDYHADPIAEMITGQITHWRPLPAPPFTPEGPSLPGRGEEP